MAAHRTVLIVDDEDLVLVAARAVSGPRCLIVDFACDHPNAQAIRQTRLSTADRDLARWLAGDRRSDNVYRCDS
jgi:hypothetical protein